MSEPRRAGRRSWLLEAGSGDEARGLAAALRADPAVLALGLAAVRTGARTVLVQLEDEQAAVRAESLLRSLTPVDVVEPPRAQVVVEVVYDGPDLTDVAAELGVSEQALVDQHRATDWQVDFCGFAPGFAYLSGWDRRVARRVEPRTRVPAGAVGLAGRFTAAYPADSPGGWRLIGRTGAPLWDPFRVPPAVLGPSTSVRFVAVRDVAVPVGRPSGDGHDPVPARGDAASRSAGLVVVEPGALTLVQDEGRSGLEHLGVPPSGAADRGAARRANRVVGNHRGAAVLETLGGLTVRAQGDAVLAVAQGVATVEDGTVWAPGTAFALPHGLAVTVEPMGSLRAYLAARGGIATAAVLGSRSRDVLSVLGPAPLAAGDLLAVGLDQGVVGAGEPDPPRDAVATVHVTPGPREDWFVRPEALTEQVWAVSVDSNRVGVRLVGEPLAHAGDEELESEPMVAGAVQVPPSGQPVILLRDHPVTGGYPVVAVVDEEDLDLVARLAPGDTLRFRYRRPR